MKTDAGSISETVDLKSHSGAKTIMAALLVAIATFLTPVAAISGQSAWKTDQEGWVLRKVPGAKDYERFFAVGLWNVPGYAFTKAGEPDSEKSNAELFLKRTQPYNMTFVQAGYQKKYMDGIIHVISSSDFPKTLNNFLDGIPGINDDQTNRAYLRAQFIRKDLSSPKLRETLDRTVARLKALNAETDCAWAPVDEIANGGGGDWNWPEGVGDIIYDRIKNQDESALVFTDLVGVGRGNTYLFEQRYLKTHESMSPTPPFELLSKEARENVNKPLRGFWQAYNGLPVYEFKGGNLGYKQYPLETLKDIWFENIRLCAAGFKKSGDVFGINAFMDFHTYPILSGLTVDAIKAGTSPQMPVWLYFDGNGYAKPAKVSAAAYVQNVKCQMYTSIIHGATGVLFWNDSHKTPEVFDALDPIIRELDERIKIFQFKTVETKIEGDLHYMIKQAPGGERYLIAANTSNTASVSFGVRKEDKAVLRPLEVIFRPIL